MEALRYAVKYLYRDIFKNINETLGEDVYEGVLEGCQYLLNELIELDLKLNKGVLLYVSLASLVLTIAGVLLYKLNRRSKDNSYTCKAIFEVHQISGDPKASSDRMKKCIQYLNEFPSLVNHRMKPYNYTPFLRACWSGNTPLVRFMIKNGANLKCRTVSKENAAYLAAYRATKQTRWDPSILNMLNDAGCPLHLVNSKGNSTLHMAVRAGHLTLTRWLLARNVHLLLPRTKVTPYQLATAIDDLNHRSIAKMLKLQTMLGTSPNTNQNKHLPGVKSFKNFVKY